MKYIIFIGFVSILGVNQIIQDNTKPSYLKLDQEITFVNDSIQKDTLKVRLLKKEQILVRYSKKTDTLYFQGAYGPISTSNLDSIDYENWDYVSDNAVIVFTDSSLNLITKNPESNIPYKKLLVTHR